MKRLLLSAVTTFVLGFKVPLWAHHAASMFDLQEKVELRGTVREFQFTNPHCFIQLVVDAHGEAAEWSIEMGAPAHLLRAGWKPHSLKAGDKVSIMIHPLRDGSKGGAFVSGARSDGQPIGAAT